MCSRHVNFFGLSITFSLLAELFSSENFSKFWEKWLATFQWQHSRGCQRFLPKFSCCQRIFPKIQNYDKCLLHIQDDTGKKKLSPDRSGNVIVNPEIGLNWKKSPIFIRTLCSFRKFIWHVQIIF